MLNLSNINLHYNKNTNLSAEHISYRTEDTDITAHLISAMTKHLPLTNCDDIAAVHNLINNLNLPIPVNKYSFTTFLIEHVTQLNIQTTMLPKNELLFPIEIESRIIYLATKLSLLLPPYRVKSVQRNVLKHIAPHNRVSIYYFAQELAERVQKSLKVPHYPPITHRTRYAISLELDILLVLQRSQYLTCEDNSIAVLTSLLHSE